MAWCFSTRASVATVLITHPCVSSYSWVNQYHCYDQKSQASTITWLSQPGIFIFSTSEYKLWMYIYLYHCSWFMKFKVYETSWRVHGVTPMVRKSNNHGPITCKCIPSDELSHHRLPTRGIRWMWSLRNEKGQITLNYLPSIFSKLSFFRRITIVLINKKKITFLGTYF